MKKRRMSGLVAGGKVAAALGLMASAPALAVQPTVSLQAGTLGAGLQVGVGFSDRFTGRIGLFDWSEELNFTASGLDYAGELELGNLALLLDLHPSGGGFHWSFGAVLSSSELVGRAPLEQLGFDLSDLPPGVELPPGFEVPDPLGFLVGTWEGEELSPYLGLGFSHTWGRNVWVVSFDVGTYYLGEPNVELTVDTALPIDSIPGAREVVNQLLEEEEASLEREARDYRFYPVVMVGVGYSL